MQDLRLEGKGVYLCLFDIFSLFTDVLLKETIGVFAEALYKDPPFAPSIPQAVFIELMWKLLRHPQSSVLMTQYTNKRTE